MTTTQVHLMLGRSTHRTHARPPQDLTNNNNNNMKQSSKGCYLCPRWWSLDRLGVPSANRNKISDTNIDDRNPLAISSSARRSKLSNHNHNLILILSIIIATICLYPRPLPNPVSAQRLIIDSRSYIVHNNHHKSPRDNLLNVIQDQLPSSPADHADGRTLRRGRQSSVVSSRTWPPAPGLAVSESRRSYTSHPHPRPAGATKGSQQQVPVVAGGSGGKRFPQPTKTSAQRTTSNRPQQQQQPSPSGLIRRSVQPQQQQQSIGNNNQQQQQSKNCALILQRTYVRKLQADTAAAAAVANNDVEYVDQVEPTGQLERVCISYDDVNQAIAAAKEARQFDERAPGLAEAIASIEPAPPFIAQLGELNQEVTRILAQRFDLSPDEILNGLPLIDMSRTDFWALCPLMVKPIQCDLSGRFRSFTGHCNNLRRPSWGAAQTPFVRFLAPRHPDGIEQDRVSVVDGSPLPSPRLVSSLVHRDVDHASSQLSLLIMVWGQIIDHDVALAAPPRDQDGLDFDCCQQQAASGAGGGSGGVHPNCKPIRLPDNDPLYAQFNQKCMDFKRSLAGLRPNCALGPRVHINTITATIDGNTIYGSTREIADQLRTFTGGQLKVQEVRTAGQGPRQPPLKPLMPKQLVRPDLDCFDRPPNVHCFLGGDERVNEQPTLTAMHTIYVRDHNRVASQLARLNPHWDDDRIYHETRHIEAATIQHILVTEYLPLLISADMMRQYNLTEAPPGAYWHGYDPQVTPSISQGFSTAAFRQGHTFIQGRVRLHDPRTHQLVGSLQLRHLFKRPYHYYQPGRMDQVLAGIVNTPAQTYDPFITEEIAGHLFQLTGQQWGMDLPAINLARGREQGTPGYNAYREWCGLPRARTFHDLVPLMANRTAHLYARLYRHVDDIDLWSGGVSERRLEGAQIGPTFACIIARQFSNIKRGDRFWYELGGQPSSFTPEQLREIKKASQARLLCKNSDQLKTIQARALMLPHPIRNPRLPCDQIPDLDLKYWRESPDQPGQFYTEANSAQADSE